MSEAVRRHLAAGLFLQAVVADGGGGGQCLFHIPRLQDAACPVSMMCPYAGEAVGLQLQAHRKLFPGHFATPGAGKLGAPPPVVFYVVAAATGFPAHYDLTPELDRQDLPVIDIDCG